MTSWTSVYISLISYVNHLPWWIVLAAVFIGRFHCMWCLIQRLQSFLLSSHFMLNMCGLQDKHGIIDSAFYYLRWSKQGFEEIKFWNPPVLEYMGSQCYPSIHFLPAPYRAGASQHWPGMRPALNICNVGYCEWWRWGSLRNYVIWPAPSCCSANGDSWRSYETRFTCIFAPLWFLISPRGPTAMIYSHMYQKDSHLLPAWCHTS